MPKSSTFTVPSVHRKMLAGFRSRWRTLASWAWASARATEMPTSTSSSMGSGPRVSRPARVSPRSSSKTR